MSTNKRIRLDLSTKFELIQDRQKGVKNIELETKYGISGSTIQNIIADKEKIMTALESNIGGKRKSMKGAASTNSICNRCHFERWPSVTISYSKKGAKYCE